MFLRTVGWHCIPEDRTLYSYRWDEDLKSNFLRAFSFPECVGIKLAFLTFERNRGMVI
jgi:hypothetical protein